MKNFCPICWSSNCSLASDGWKWIGLLAIMLLSLISGVLVVLS